MSELSDHGEGGSEQSPPAERPPADEGEPTTADSAAAPGPASEAPQPPASPETNAQIDRPGTDGPDEATPSDARPPETRPPADPPPEKPPPEKPADDEPPGDAPPIEPPPVEHPPEDAPPEPPPAEHPPDEHPPEDAPPIEPPGKSSDSALTADAPPAGSSPAERLADPPPERAAAQPETPPASEISDSSSAFGGYPEGEPSDADLDLPPAEERTTADDPRWNETAEMLPRDDSGYQVTPRDCEFLGLDPQQVRDWSTRDAPLGMTPAQYDDFRGDVFDGLQNDGVGENDVDARLQGSSAHFFSGPHKDFPQREDLPDDTGRATFDDWRADQAENPARRPFDSMNRLGLDDPSDYDLQLSSDALVDRCRAERDASYPDRPLMNPKYGFVDKDIAATALPNLQQACEHQSDVLGREVNPAIFGSDGPPRHGAGPSSHFRDDDWMLHRRRHR